MAAEDQAPAADAPVADATPAADTSAASDSTPEVTADSFGWDGWDGSEDSLPETVRPWVSKAGGYYTKQSDLARQEADRVRQVYESMMEGREDPRLAELKAQLEEHGKTRQQIEQERDRFKGELEQFVSQQQQYAEAQAVSRVEAFQKANAWIFDDPELQKAGAALLDEDFEDTDLPVLLRMPEDLLKLTRDIHKELRKTGAKNVSGHAMELARARHKPVAPRPAAKLISGARGGAPSSTTPKPLTTDDDMKTWKDRAIEHALSVVKK